MLPHRGFQAYRTRRLGCFSWVFLRRRRKKAILGSTSVARANLRRVCLIGASPVTSSSLARCVAGTAQVTFIAAFLISAPVELAAAQTPTAQELAGLTASGSYLAARHAGRQRNAAIEAAYYRAALKRDPKNSELLDRAFLSLVVGGDIDEAVKLGERVAQADKIGRASCRERVSCCV